MRVFITGATGYVGGAVAEAFLSAGHHVTALVRSPARGEHLSARGATLATGDLRTPATYAPLLGDQDVLVHTALEYGDRTEERVEVERLAVRTLLGAARSGGRAPFLLYTSNAYLLGGLGEVEESTLLPQLPPDRQWRLDLEGEVLALNGGGGPGRAAVVRPGMCYGGLGGTLPHLFAAARRDGATPVVGSGDNRWSLCYVHDLAQLYLRIAEQRAGGVFHGTDGASLSYLRVAELVARAAGYDGRIARVSLEAAIEREGRHAEVLARDVAVLPSASRALGWAPTLPSFEVGAAVAHAEWAALAGEGA